VVLAAVLAEAAQGGEDVCLAKVLRGGGGSVTEEIQ